MFDRRSLQPYLEVASDRSFLGLVVTLSLTGSSAPPSLIQPATKYLLQRETEMFMKLLWAISLNVGFAC